MKYTTNEQISFENTSLNDAHVESWHWFINGEEVSSSHSFSYQFPSVGVYEIKLQAWGSWGSNPVELKEMITIVEPTNPPAVLDQEMPDLVQGIPYQFKMRSVSETGYGNMQWEAVGFPRGISISPMGEVSGIPFSDGGLDPVIVLTDSLSRQVHYHPPIDYFRPLAFRLSASSGTVLDTAYRVKSWSVYDHLRLLCPSEDQWLNQRVDEKAFLSESMPTLLPSGINGNPALRFTNGQFLHLELPIPLKNTIGSYPVVVAVHAGDRDSSNIFGMLSTSRLTPAMDSSLVNPEHWIRRYTASSMKKYGYQELSFSRVLPYSPSITIFREYEQVSIIEDGILRKTFPIQTSSDETGVSFVVGDPHSTSGYTDIAEIWVFLSDPGISALRSLGEYLSRMYEIPSYFGGL